MTKDVEHKSLDFFYCDFGILKNILKIKINVTLK